MTVTRSFALLGMFRSARVFKPLSCLDLIDISDLIVVPATLLEVCVVLDWGNSSLDVLLFLRIALRLL